MTKATNSNSDAGCLYYLLLRQSTFYEMIRWSLKLDGITNMIWTAVIYLTFIALSYNKSKANQNVQRYSYITGSEDSSKDHGVGNENIQDK